VTIGGLQRPAASAGSEGQGGTVHAFVEHEASGMTVLFAVFLVVHGLIHLLGFAKAFHVAELPQLAQSISPPIGVTWLAAAVVFILSAGCLFLWPRGWWLVAGMAVGLSMIAVIPSWADAKFGAVANVLVLLGGRLLELPRAPLAR
jgi:hypothetical protein